MLVKANELQQGLGGAAYFYIWQEEEKANVFGSWEDTAAQRRRDGGVEGGMRDGRSRRPSGCNTMQYGALLPLGM
ncbi:hypothetical protein E2C01_048110 [Portunus trituberculatus]|uniref:Uncharacterized protein n=1 Tax=Portunus trituberculatus TaxID=210409 RepID=A0A5B7G5I9_PORTR|nr:hypothetical protein [Portunus trituberculatus]